MSTIWDIPGDLWLAVDEYADLRHLASSCRRLRNMDIYRSRSVRVRSNADPVPWFLRHHARVTANLSLRCESSPVWLAPLVTACSRLGRLILRTEEHRVDVAALAVALEGRGPVLKHFALSMCCAEGLVGADMGALQRAVRDCESVRLRLSMCHVDDGLLEAMADAVADAVPRWQTYRLSLKHNDGVSDRGMGRLLDLWRRCPLLTDLRLNTSYTTVTHRALRGVYGLSSLTTAVIKADKDVFDDGIVDGRVALGDWQLSRLQRWEWSVAYHTIHSMPSPPASVRIARLHTAVLDTEGCQWDPAALTGRLPPPLVVPGGRRPAPRTLLAYLPPTLRVLRIRLACCHPDMLEHMANALRSMPHLDTLEFGIEGHTVTNPEAERLLDAIPPAVRRLSVDFGSTRELTRLALAARARLRHLSVVFRHGSLREFSVPSGLEALSLDAELSWLKAGSFGLPADAALYLTGALVLEQDLPRFAVPPVRVVLDFESFALASAETFLRRMLECDLTRLVELRVRWPTWEPGGMLDPNATLAEVVQRATALRTLDMDVWLRRQASLCCLWGAARAVPRVRVCLRSATDVAPFVTVDAFARAMSIGNRIPDVLELDVRACSVSESGLLSLGEAALQRSQRWCETELMACAVDVGPTNRGPLRRVQDAWGCRLRIVRHSGEYTNP